MSQIRPQRQLAEIDALRGLAILAVFAVHTSGWLPPAGRTLLATMQAGASGVQLFYVVSAYSLFRSFRMRAETAGFSVAGYAARRLFRIAPMFWAAIAFYLAVDGTGPRWWAPNGLSGIDIALTALFLHGWSATSANSVVPGGWSVGVEMSVYVVLPLAFAYIRTARSALLVTIATMGIEQLFGHAYMAGAVAAYPGHLYLPYTWAWTFSPLAQLPVFGVGMLAFFLADDLAQFRGAGLVWCALAAFLLGEAGRAAVEQFVSQQLIYGLGFGFLLLAALSGEIGLFRNRVLVHIGRVSYSAYLLQFFVLDHLARALGSLTMVHSHTLRFTVGYLLLAAATVALATVTFHLIERPFMRLGSRVAGHLDRRFGTTPVAHQRAHGAAMSAPASLTR